MLDFLQPTDLTLGPLFVSLLLGLATIALLFGYSFRKQSHWKKIGIPYVKPWPILGSIDTLRVPLQDVELDRYNKYGTIYGTYEGNKPVLSVAEPDIIRQILVKDFPAFTYRRDFNSGDKIVDKFLSVVKGEDWKRIRTIISPTFTTGKIKRMISIFKECSETLAENFKKAAENGKPVDVKSIYSAFTMDVIASSAFSTKIDSHNDPYNPFVQHARKFFTREINWRFIFFIILPSLARILRLDLFGRDVTKFFYDVTLQIIQERKNTEQTGNDFLQLLLDTSKELEQDGKLDLNDKDDIAKNYGEEEGGEIFKQDRYTKKTLSLDEIVAQCVIFFLAGFDTTASTLSFASYLLALNPGIQEKLIKEVDEVLKENNGELSYEAIHKMKYLDNVISETLRVFPPVPRLERTADEDYKLEGKDITISKGMVVTIPVHGIHRDPKYYPDPEKFDPDRFNPEERAKRHQYVYLPFGHGPRNCVAMRFALMEVKVCLSHVMSNFRIKTCPETKVPLEFYVGQALLQPKEIMLELEIRKDKVKVTREE